MFNIASRATCAISALALVAGLALVSLPAQAEDPLAKGDRETFFLSEDRLAVTLGTPRFGDGSETESYAIWVGEVERHGRKMVWVELIDEYGEVVYDSEVAQNETHLLPDGRAIAVRALLGTEEAAPAVAKADQSRVAPDARLVVTRRIVNDPSQQTEIEFIEQKPVEEPSAMMRVAAFGQMVWAKIVASLTLAADGIKVAWTWLTEPFRA